MVSIYKKRFTKHFGWEEDRFGGRRRRVSKEVIRGFGAGLGVSGREESDVPSIQKV